MVYEYFNLLSKSSLLFLALKHKNNKMVTTTATPDIVAAMAMTVTVLLVLAELREDMSFAPSVWE